MSDETVFQCPDCDRVLKNQAGLLSHMKTHAPKAAPDKTGEYLWPEVPVGTPVTDADLINIPITVLKPDERLDTNTGQIVKVALPEIGNVVRVPLPYITGAAAQVSADDSHSKMTYNEYLEKMRGFMPGQTGAVPQMPNGETFVGTISSGTPGIEHRLVPVPPALIVKIKKLPHYRDLPDLKKATPGSAAFDIYAAIDKDVVIGIDDWKLIPTGLCMEVPFGWWGLCAPRSGLAANDGITVLNTPGVIDSDYRGEIKVNLVNHTTKKFVVKPGMRICQIMFQKVYEAQLVIVDELSETSRGEGGFGSTGKF